ncbi:MAG: hypothetical protein HUK08_01530, partial [Bacteroidaceae bacterium]|nr:hypothetical protein [Bacteroidaceae bacterium]
DVNPYITKVYDFVPAPGQFVNTAPTADEQDTPATMAEKCTQSLANNRRGIVSLGGYGGYITFCFDHSVRNAQGRCDFAVYGNAFDGSSEPGIVMVAQDTNGNGLPDDTWYELAGSADIDSIGKVTYGYEITYGKSPMSDIPWTDNRGCCGFVRRNTSHSQEYYPLWLPHVLTFRGTLLPNNATDTSASGSNWVLTPLRYGYADNLPNSNLSGCSFDIDWAVDDSRTPVHLDHIDFIRVYSATNQQCGWIGEVSTEISGAQDLLID